MLLQVRDLKTYFHTAAGPARAVDGVSFDLNAGETFALVGESGCGKSITALSIMQLVPEPAGYYAGGAILYQGQDLLRLSELDKQQLRGRKIAMIFQEPMTALNPVLTVGYQLIEPLRRYQRLGTAAARTRALELLTQVAIPDPEHRLREYPHQLSGGMKQRVMIAMAMAGEPDLLIADEPTTALDVTVQAEILALMRDLQAQCGTAILLITHDLGVVATMADRVAIMYAGRIVEIGSRDQALHHPAHPYTVKLLQSIPSQAQRQRSLQTIEGHVPPAYDLPAGCRFAPRCHVVQEACWQTDPPLFQVVDDHRAACLLYDSQRTQQASVTSALHATSTPQARATGKLTATLLLQLRGVQVHFPIRRGVFKRVVGYVRAVDGVDLQIHQGTTLALVGESGCGKTTLGKALLQLIRPTAGHVFFQGQDLTTLTRHGLHPFRRRLQVIFQDPYASLNPRMMVGEIVMEGMAAHGIGHTRQGREARVHSLLAQVGLDPSVINRYPHEFSGGQRQRIGIARCLAVEPEFIVCDEATSALDVSVQAQILNLLAQLQADLGLTYLFITHNLGVVEYLADEVAVMYLGRVVEHGTTAEVFEHPAHPYTQALLSAVPRLDAADHAAAIRLTGDVPSPTHPPHGCHFHPRCPFVMPQCRESYPPTAATSASHRVACFLPHAPPAHSS
jgi:peptide/nickel transport system ATP-binding protein